MERKYRVSYAFNNEGGIFCIGSAIVINDVSDGEFLRFSKEELEDMKDAIQDSIEITPVVIIGIIPLKD